MNRIHPDPPSQNKSRQGGTLILSLLLEETNTNSQMRMVFGPWFVSLYIFLPTDLIQYLKNTPWAQWQYYNCPCAREKLWSKNHISNSQFHQNKTKPGNPRAYFMGYPQHRPQGRTMGDSSHKWHHASDEYPTMHHFVTEMCTHVHISVTKWSIVGYGTGALWDLCHMSLLYFKRRNMGYSGSTLQCYTYLDEISSPSLQ